MDWTFRYVLQLTFFFLASSLTLAAVPTPTTPSVTATGPDELLISWDYWEQADVIVNSYIATATNAFTEIVEGSCKSGLTSCSISGLQPSMPYEIHIVLETESGEKSGAAMVISRTWPTAPPKPEGVTATPLGNGRVFVAWLPPVTPTGMLEAYYAEVYNSATKALVAACKTHTVSCEVTGMNIPGTYEVRVRGQMRANDDGSGGGLGDAGTCTIEAQGAVSVPPSPTGVTASGTGPYSLTVRWKAPPEGPVPIKEYAVRLTNLIDHKTSIGCRTTTTTCFIENGLKISTDYGVSVHAVSDTDGYSENTETVFVATTSVEASVPTELSITEHTVSSFRATWLQPAVVPGVLKEYTVVVYDALTLTEVKTLTVTEPTVVISSLKPFSAYVVGVQMMVTYPSGALYTGAFVNSAWERTLSDKPSPPLDVSMYSPSGTELFANWAAPENPNGAIEHYLATLYIGDVEAQPTITTVAAAWHFTDLIPNTAYNLKVKVVTKEPSESELAVSESVSTLPGAPVFDAPPTVTLIDPTTIQVDWNQVTDSNGEFTHYVVQAYDKLTFAGFCSVPKDDTTCIIEHLEPYTEYTISVGARTKANAEKRGGAVGTSPEATITTQAATATAPEDITLTVEATKMTVKWKAPYKMNGEFLHYNVYSVNTESGSSWEELCMKTIALQCEFTPEVPDAPFHFKVEAATVADPPTTDGIVGDAAYSHEEYFSPPPAGVPSEVMASTPAAKTVKVTWKAPVGSIGPFDVQLLFADGMLFVEKENVATPEHTFVDVLEFQFFYVKVRTTTPADSQYSSSQMVQSWPMIAPELKGFTVVNGISGDLYVKWDVPSSINGRVSYQLNALDTATPIIQSSKYPSAQIKYPTGGVEYDIEGFISIAPTSTGQGGTLGPRTIATINTLPNFPNKVTAAKLQPNGTVRLTWQPPTKPNGKIGVYYISMTDATTKKVAYAAETTALEHTITTLDADKEYVTCVLPWTSANDEGWGGAPAVGCYDSAFPTHARKPTAPNDVQLTLQGVLEAKVTWAAPTHQNGPTGDYHVVLKQHYGDAVVLEVDTAESSHIFTKLDDKYAYYVEVSSRTKPGISVQGGGEGPVAKTSSVWTARYLSDAPTNVQNTKENDTAYEVTWVAVAIPGGMSAVYVVKAFSIGNQTVAADCYTTDTTCVLGGLQHFTEYFVSISTMFDDAETGSRMGYSMVATSTKFKTAAGPPRLPANPFARSTNDTITVAWSDPGQNSAEVPTYMVTVTNLKTNTVVKKCETPGFICEATGLTVFTEYEIVIVPVGAAARQETRFKASTLPGIPSPPTSIELVPSDNGILVKWAPPTSPNGIISQYRVDVYDKLLFYPAGVCITTDLFCEITGLEKGRAYVVAVQAKNTGGGFTSGSSSATSEGYISTTGGTTDPDKYPVTTGVDTVALGVGLGLGLPLLLIIIILIVLLLRSRNREKGYHVPDASDAGGDAERVTYPI